MLNKNCPRFWGRPENGLPCDLSRRSRALRDEDGSSVSASEQSEAWWPETESNCRHEDFQSSALPTELSGRELSY